MILFSKLIKDVKNIAILILLALLLLFYSRSKALGDKVAVLEHNVTELTNKNSTVLQVTKGELKDLIKADPKLQARLGKANIKTNRVTEYKTIYVNYKDSTAKKYTFVIDTIKAYRTVELDTTITDSTSCFKSTISGRIKDNKLEIEVKERQFKTEASAVTYQTRKKWRFLFISSRILGKKEYKTEIISDCGEVKIRGAELIKK